MPFNSDDGKSQSAEPTELTVEYVLENIEPYRLFDSNQHECVFDDEDGWLCILVSCIYTETTTGRHIKMGWKKTKKYKKDFFSVLLKADSTKVREITKQALSKYIKENDMQLG